MSDIGWVEVRCLPIEDDWIILHFHGLAGEVGVV